MPAHTVLLRCAVVSPQAIETFLKDMGLTAEQFLDRKALVDLVVAYHIIPGVRVACSLALKQLKPGACVLRS
jgi:hypothetical protein